MPPARERMLGLGDAELPLFRMSFVTAVPRIKVCWQLRNMAAAHSRQGCGVKDAGAHMDTGCDSQQEQGQRCAKATTVPTTLTS